jgi:hypothetical protein
MAPPIKKRTVLTAQQEIFAQEYLRHGNAARAYRSAYNVKESTKASSIYTEASKLLHDPKIARRIMEVRDKAMKSLKISKSDLIIDLKRAQELALDIEQPAAAVTATRTIAQIAGHLVEKREITGKDGAAIEVNETLSAEQIGMNEIARRIAYLLQAGRTSLIEHHKEEEIQ